MKQLETRYIRILGHGNSVNKWSSYTEVRIYQLPVEEATDIDGDKDGFY
ncbi:MAG: hypothetical protein IKA09_04260 [Lachnospiraceae bacterium]|nr:hypothetical protein [Lachnospiraceae bacterium]